MLRRMGVLMAGDQSYPAFATFRDELRSARERFGFSVETISRFAGGRHEILPSLASEIVSTDPEVIVAIGAVAHFAVRAVAGSNIPIVFAIVVDPYATGVVAHHRAPDTKVTGVTSYDSNQIAEQIRLLKDTLGTVNKLAIIGDADVPPFLAELAEQFCVSQGITPITRLLHSKDEIRTAIAAFHAEGARALLGLEVPRISTHCIEIVEAATLAGLPTMFGRDLVRAAPLLAYGTSFSDATRRAASLALEILAGDDPGSLPIETTARKELIVNLGVARRLNLDVPGEILDAAISTEIL